MISDFTYLDSLTLTNYLLAYLNWNVINIKINKTISLTLFLGSTPEDEAPEANTTFMVPKKEISMVPDMGKWKRSQVDSSLLLCVLLLFFI